LSEHQIKAAKVKRPKSKDADLFTEAELFELKAEADKKILEDRKKAARIAALAEFEKEAKAEVDPAEEIVDYVIDLAGYADKVMIDGVVYWHGKLYKLPRKKYESIREIVQASWRHERAIGGANANAYRQPSLPVLSGGDRARSQYLAV
jgi:hypothetical protein